MTVYEDLQKRCQRGATNLNDANNLLAECYGVIGALVIEKERTERNRDMWKGQVERQSEEIAKLRQEIRVMDVLAEAMAEVKATSDGESTQPIADIVAGCLAEIAALSKEG
ncbi:hypothetical protein [Pseudomonas fluorescens]|uniref:hypothetical protein n=1 Tax=Pseudomonas fluorescens TaxID=294 RepID=UPI0028548367|nr:hypothetical protein [Pseudomonas fluorescens]MDR6163536.1 hypothetical protein [Pseudomonas fluorescens]